MVGMGVAVDGEGRDGAGSWDREVSHRHHRRGQNAVV